MKSKKIAFTPRELPKVPVLDYDASDKTLAAYVAEALREFVAGHAIEIEIGDTWSLAPWSLDSLLLHVYSNQRKWRPKAPVKRAARKVKVHLVGVTHDICVDKTPKGWDETENCCKLHTLCGNEGVTTHDEDLATCQKCLKRWRAKLKQQHLLVMGISSQGATSITTACRFPAGGATPYLESVTCKDCITTQQKTEVEEV